MDLPATLDVVDGPLSGEDESQEEVVAWGRLFSVGKGFRSVGGCGHRSVLWGQV